MIGILTKVFYTFGSSLVILAWTSDKLSRRQAHDWRPHGQTQAKTIPESQIALGKNTPHALHVKYGVPIFSILEKSSYDIIKWTAPY